MGQKLQNFFEIYFKELYFPKIQIGIAYMDQVLEELTLVKAIILVAVILIIYVIVLVAYWIASGRFNQKKHSEARTRVKKYSHNLLVLNKLYEKENM